MNAANTETHTDIKSGGWISRLPPALRPYALLMRLDRPAGTWLLLLPGLWAIALAAQADGGSFAAHHAVLFVLFGIGAVIMRGAGCVINDLWDRRIDRQVARTAQRPLASGAIHTRAAVTLLLFLLAAGFLILLQLPSTAIVLGLLSVPLIVVYPLMKRITWWPQLFLGITFNFGALIGWTAVTGTVTLPAFLLYTAGIFWTLAYDTIYALQDIEDDMRIGVKSTAIRFGAHNKKWIAGFFAASWIFLALSFAAAGAGGVSLLFLILPAAQVAMQMRGLHTANPASCLKQFKSNRDFGLLVLLAALI